MKAITIDAIKKAIIRQTMPESDIDCHSHFSQARSKLKVAVNKFLSSKIPSV